MKKATLNLSLYLVLDPDLCGGKEGVLNCTAEAVRHGVSIVQLRAPTWKKHLWLETALALKGILAPYQVPLIINDHLDVALAADADGLHLGQEDLPVAIARRFLGPDKWLGLSINKAEQLAQLPASLDYLDYLGVGPVNATTTKRDATPTLSAAELDHILSHKPLPMVAIGGIGRAHAYALIQRGADGLAVVSAICGQPDVAAATQGLITEIKRARIHDR